MRQIIGRSILVTLSVIAVSQIVSFSIRMATGQEFSAYLFAMNCILPLATALPASLLIFWQQRRLRLAHAALLTAHDELTHTAAHDHLTGLLNRSTFLSRIADYTGQPSVLLIIDADNFKKINDTFGHAEGDVALALIAGAIGASLNADSLAGRIGGEEFAVFAPGLASGGGLALAEKIRDAVADIPFYPAHGDAYHLNVSIGAAPIAKGGDLVQAFRQADANLYKAKASGRNTVVSTGIKPHLAAIQ